MVCIIQYCAASIRIEVTIIHCYVVCRAILGGYGCNVAICINIEYYASSRLSITVAIIHCFAMLCLEQFGVALISENCKTQWQI